MAHKPTREEAWAILTEHVKSPSLPSHALAVEAVMRHFARKMSADEELWGAIGLVPFVRMRRMLVSHEELARTVAALEGKYDSRFRVVFDAIHALMEPPKTPRHRIGYMEGLGSESGHRWNQEG
jgi:predicted hydrolase (HD superfamily)